MVAKDSALMIPCCERNRLFITLFCILSKLPALPLPQGLPSAPDAVQMLLHFTPPSYYR